jgi:HEAT repeat protein
VIRQELLRVLENGEEQSRRFAAISLAQSASRPGQGQDAWAGLREVTAVLSNQMLHGPTGVRPWGALALGVLGRGLSDRGQMLDSTINADLLASCEKEKDPASVGAYCLALGLRAHAPAIPVLLHHLQEGFKGSDDARGEAAIALGLIDDASSIAPIQAVIEESRYRPELLKQAAVALGLLGDRQIVTKLVEMLASAKGFASQAALASALGAIGDSTSIDPLLALLRDAAATDAARGFAAVALGTVCDAEDLPRIARIAIDTNYRANTPTLIGAGTGVLEIL